MLWWGTAWHGWLRRMGSGRVDVAQGSRWLVPVHVWSVGGGVLGCGPDSASVRGQKQAVTVASGGRVPVQGQSQLLLLLLLFLFFERIYLFI